MSGPGGERVSDAAGGGEPLATDSDGLGCRFRGGLSHLSAGSHSQSQVGGGESENSGVEWSGMESASPSVLSSRRVNRGPWWMGGRC